MITNGEPWHEKFLVNIFFTFNKITSLQDNEDIYICVIIPHWPTCSNYLLRVSKNTLVNNLTCYLTLQLGPLDWNGFIFTFTPLSNPRYLHAAMTPFILAPSGLEKHYTNDWLPTSVLPTGSQNFCSHHWVCGPRPTDKDRSPRNWYPSLIVLVLRMCVFGGALGDIPEWWGWSGWPQP